MRLFVAIGPNKGLSAGPLRSLSESEKLLGKIYERLSSGLRINSAADDAAGIALATSLNASSRIYAQALRNNGDAVSLLNIADSALSELAGVVMRQKELAEQAANGVYSARQRLALDRESDALTREFNRIVQATKFNGRELLNDPGTAFRIQLGVGLEESISFNLGSEFARTTGDGTFAAPQLIGTGSNSIYDAAVADYNGDGNLDFAMAYSGQLALYLGNGNGSFLAPQNRALPATSKFTTEAVDFNNDGIIDVLSPNSANNSYNVQLGNGDGTFSQALYAVGFAALHRTAAGDVNGDRYADVVAVSSANISVSLANANGTFNAPIVSAHGAINTDTVAVADLNNDGLADLAVGDFSSGNLYVHLSNGDGTLLAPRVHSSGTGVAGRAFAADLNDDGILDLVTQDTTNNKSHIFIGNGNGTFKASVSYAHAPTSPVLAEFADLNGDGTIDILSSDGLSNRFTILLNNGDGTFRTGTSVSAGTGTANGFAFGDFNEDGALDFIAPMLGVSSAALFISNTRESAIVESLNLTTVSGARSALTTLDATLQRILGERAGIGAMLSRLEIAAAAITSRKETLTAAADRIQSADIAEEAANLVRAQIMQSTSAALLAQANQNGALALQLLR